MNEGRLRTLLREEPIPGAAEAERRGVELVTRAYAERRPERQPVRLRRLAFAFALAALLAALILSPAGAAVRDWVDDVFTAGVDNAEPALTDVPGGGSLLVQSPRGPWVVQADGSRRLLGSYGEATWSPHGLFVVASSGRTLSAIETDGTPRWSISAGGRIGDPRWSPSGFRIAYRAGRSLRVERADGTASTRVAATSAAVPPAWYPPGPHVLAYIDAGRRLVVAEAETGSTIDASGASPGVTGLSWSRDGKEILEVARRGIWLRDVRIGKLAGFFQLGAAARVKLPASAVVRDAAFAPPGRTVAILLERRSAAGPRSEALLVDPSGGPARRIFAVSGRLTELAWSPDGHRLLLAWPAADQWLFVPITRGPSLRVLGNVASVFAPGRSGRVPFPQIEGWCCPPAPGGGG
jgi:hypothetical protein